MEERERTARRLVGFFQVSYTHQRRPSVLLPLRAGSLAGSRWNGLIHPVKLFYRARQSRSAKPGSNCRSVLTFWVRRGGRIWIAGYVARGRTETPTPCSI